MYLLDSAHIWHVAKTGNDSNGGHAQQYPVSLASDAKLTIGAAVTAAASGDTIIIWPGDYAENVSLGSKALTVIGTSRNKSKIVPASGDAITLADNCVLSNVAAEGIAFGAYGVKCYQKSNVVIEDCDIYGSYDGLYAVSAQDLFLRNCRIRGQFDGCNLGSAKLTAIGCLFTGLGTLSTTVACRGAYGSSVGTYSDCIFSATRNDVSSEAVGAIKCTGGLSVYENCVFKATAGAGHTGSAFGVQVDGAGAMVILKNCVVSSSSTHASVGPYDLSQINGILAAAGCAYNTANGTIIQGGSGKLDQAIKSLVNKAAQNKSTGAIQYYDDDGETVLLTATPTDADSTITRTPS